MALNGNSVLVSSGVNGGRAVLRFTGTSANIAVANNSSEIGNPTDEALTGAAITGMWWSAAAGGGNSSVNGCILISRGTTPIANLSGTGFLSQVNGWRGDGSNAVSNVVVTFATPGGSLYLELSKQYATGKGNRSSID